MAKGSGLPLLSEASIKKGMRVIVRADLDVAASKYANAGISNEDMFRLRRLVPTIRYLLRKDASVRLIGHRGRPGGAPDPKLSLGQAGRVLARMLGRKIFLVRNPFGNAGLSGRQPMREVLLFENLRFWPGEEQNSIAFARGISRWGDIYVNEAFANCHRAHASMVGLPELLRAYAGMNLAAEIEALGRVVRRQKHPFVAILGGAKLETKMPLIRRFLRDADAVLIGGALANTLFALGGKEVGKSLAYARENSRLTFSKNKKLHLPPDVIVADTLRAGARHWIRSVGEVRADEYIADIGPSGRKLFAELLYGAKTVVWNGPLGFAEVREFAKGTMAIAKAMRKVRGFTMVGGGDTIAALSRYKLLKGFSHVSTGGGAMLEFLAGKRLPAIEALKR